MRSVLGTVARIVSGGQTGVDRAALDWAIERNLPHGGWCPKGRRAEDGTIPPRYRLDETASPRYETRTRANVVSSDATLILNLGALDGGTLLTAEVCRRRQKPCLVIQLDSEPIGIEVARTRAWLRANDVRTLNIAGPRESTRPGSYAAARNFLVRLAQGGAA